MYIKKQGKTRSTDLPSLLVGIFAIPSLEQRNPFCLLWGPLSNGAFSTIVRTAYYGVGPG